MSEATTAVASAPSDEPAAVHRLLAAVGLPGLLVALAAATGFVAFPWAGSGYDARYALVAICAAAWVAAWAFAPRLGWRVDPVLARASAVAGMVVLASTLLSPLPLDALFSEATTEAGALHWLANFAVFVLAAAIPFDRRVATGLSLTFLWVAPIAFAGFGQSMFGAVRTVLENADYFSAAMVLFLPLAFALAATASRRWATIGWLSVAAMLAISIAGAQTSSGLAGMAVALLLTGAYAYKAFGVDRPVPGARWLAAAIAAGLLAMQIPAVLRALVAAPVVGRLIGVAGTTRANFWTAAAEAFAESPMLGHGVDGYARAVQGHMPAAQFALESAALPQYVLPADAHSAIWTIAVLFGAVGLLVLGWLTYLWAVRLPFGWSGAREVGSPDDADLELVRAAVAVGTLAYATVLLFVPMSLLAGSMLSLFAGLSVARIGGPAVPAAHRRSSAARITAAVVAIALASLGLLRAVDSGQLAWAVGTKDPAIQQAALARSIAMEPFRAEIRFLRLLQVFSVDAVAGDLSEFHDAVDAERPSVTGYAPYLSFLTMVSLVQAEQSGRTDLEWERAALVRAGELGPHLPMVKSSALHLAVLQRDEAAARAAVKRLQDDEVPELYWKALVQPKIGPLAP